MYAHALRAEGYEPRLFDTAEEVIDACRREPVAAVVTRILQREGQDGIELTRRLKSGPSTRSLPVLVITTQVQPRFRASAYAAGCDRFVTLPCAPDVLVAELRALLEPASRPGDPGDTSPAGDISSA
jgi:CheY-like chemotaxis protein